MTTKIRRVVWAFQTNDDFTANLVISQGETSRELDLGRFSSSDEAYHHVNAAADNLILTLVGAGVRDIELVERITFHDMRRDKSGE